MGIDLLDLTFRVEKEFGIKLERDGLLEFLHAGNTDEPPTGAWTDIRVRDFLEYVRENLERQKVESTTEIYERVCDIIAETLGVDDSEITLDAWLVKDLGME